MDWTKDTEHLRKAYLIPMTLQSRVCMCAEPSNVSTVHLKMNHCNKCLLPYRWYVRHCTECGDWFIKDFRNRLLDCARHTKCWNHLLLVCECEKEHSTREDFGPLGMNPKKYTREQTRNIFAMPGPFD